MNYTLNDIFDVNSPYYNGALSFGTTTGSQNNYTEGTNPSTVASGSLGSQLTVDDGYLQSGNFITGSTGWQLDADGNLEANSGTFRGTITATTGAIGGFDIGTDYLRDAANSMGLASTVTGGDDVRFWAGDTFANRATAPFRVTEAGAVTGSSITITGGSVASSVLSGLIAQANLDVANSGWQYDGAFSSTDADTVAWATGTFTTASGTTYSITGANTGNMAARTYVYLDTATSTTAFQTSTTASDAVGAGKVLVAVAENSTTEATFQVFGGIGGTKVTASDIEASSITANEIAASTITSGKLSVAQLSAIAADLGSITAGDVTLDTSGFIKGGQTAYNTGTGFFLGYDTAAYKLSLGSPTGQRLTWDGSALNIVGTQSTSAIFTAGENITAGDALAGGWYQSDTGIQYDTAVSGSTVPTSGAFSTSSITVGSNSNRILVLSLKVNWTGSSASDLSAVAATFNSVSMSLLGSSTATSDSGNSVYTALMVLVAPSTGSYTVDISNITGAGADTNSVSYSVFSVYNCKQTSVPEDYAVGSAERSNAGVGSNLAITSTSTSEAALTVASGGDETLYHTAGIGGDTGIMVPKGDYNMTKVVGNGGVAAGTLITLAPYTAPTAAVIKAIATNPNITNNWATTTYRSKGFIGFALETFTAGNAGACVIGGQSTDQTSLTSFAQYYLSDTAGAVSTTAGTNTRKVGIATSTTDILITNIW